MYVPGTTGGGSWKSARNGNSLAFYPIQPNLGRDPEMRVLQRGCACNQLLGCGISQLDRPGRAAPRRARPGSAYRLGTGWRRVVTSPWPKGLELERRRTCSSPSLTPTGRHQSGFPGKRRPDAFRVWRKNATGPKRRNRLFRRSIRFKNATRAVLNAFFRGSGAKAKDFAIRFESDMTAAKE